MRRSIASSLSRIGVVSSTGFALLNQLKMASSPSVECARSFILPPPLAPPSLLPSRVPLCGALREEFCCWACANVETLGVVVVFLEERGARGGGNLLQDGNLRLLAGYFSPDRAANALRYSSCSGVTFLRAAVGMPRKSNTREKGRPNGIELARLIRNPGSCSAARPRCLARSDAPGSSKWTASAPSHPPPHCCHV